MAARRDVIVLMLGALLLYTLNVDFWIFGDSGMYADYAMRRDFSEVSLHFGYYLMVIGFQAVGAAVFGIPIQETMGWMAVLFGTLTIGVVYLLATELLGNRAVAILTTLIFGLSGRVITNATSSEVYMSQTFFVLASFLFFVRGRTIWTAAMATASLLISPLSAFAFLFFPVYDYQQHGRIRWKELSTLAAIAFAMYLPYLITHGYDLLWGPRGLLVINVVAKTDPLSGLRNFPKYQFKQFTAMLLLLIPAIVAFKKNPRFLWLSLAVAIPHIYIIIKLVGEDNVFILNTDFFFAAALALGWMELASHRVLRWLGPATFAAHVGLYLASRALFAFEYHRDYDVEMRDIAKQYLHGQQSSLITDWGTAIALTFYGREKPVSAVMYDSLFARIYNTEDEPQIDPNVLNVPKLYLIDRWKPMPLNRLLSSQASIEKQFALHSTRQIAERRLNISCRLLQEKTNKLYECTPAKTVPPS